MFLGGQGLSKQGQRSPRRPVCWERNLRRELAGGRTGDELVVGSIEEAFLS